jgi:ribosomal protein S18 acetylase RimI-like enzyme
MTAMETTVRRYLPGDLEGCRAMWVRLTEHHREIYDAPGIGGDDPGKQFDDHLSRVGPEYIWMAESGGQLVGLVGLIPHEDDEPEIEPIVVARGHRRSGIGLALMDAVFAAAKARDMGRLEVMPVSRNDSAIGSYHHLGFDIASQVELLYDGGASDRWRPGLEVGESAFRI